MIHLAYDGVSCGSHQELPGREKLTSWLRSLLIPLSPTFIDSPQTPPSPFLESALDPIIQSLLSLATVSLLMPITPPYHRNLPVLLFTSSGSQFALSSKVKTVLKKESEEISRIFSPISGYSIQHWLPKVSFLVFLLWKPEEWF